MTASYRGEQLSHDISFPGESASYRSARNELSPAEIVLRRQAEEAAAQRRTLSLGGEIPKDYAFAEWDAAAGAARLVRLSGLFGGKTRCSSTASCSSRPSAVSHSRWAARVARPSSTRSTARCRT